MRKVALFVGLALLAIAGSARAQEEAPATEPAAAGPAASSEAVPVAAAVPTSKMKVGVAFLPMLSGSIGTGTSGDTEWADMSPAYGVGLSFSYQVVAGLSVGVAPQMLFRVKDKTADKSMKQYDLMARIAYEYAVLPKLAVYAELLPGYSIVSFPSGTTFGGETPPSPKGLVLGFGAGAAYDVSDLVFVNLGVGYQMGFQKFPFDGGDQDAKTKFLRVAVGVGVKL